MKRVRYAEVPLPQSNNSLFNGQSSLKWLPLRHLSEDTNQFSNLNSFLYKDPEGATKNPGRAEVLVPNTCEMDASQISSMTSSIIGLP